MAKLLKSPRNSQNKTKSQHRRLSVINKGIELNLCLINIWEFFYLIFFKYKSDERRLKITKEELESKEGIVIRSHHGCVQNTVYLFSY